MCYTLIVLHIQDSYSRFFFHRRLHKNRSFSSSIANRTLMCVSFVFVLLSCVSSLLGLAKLNRNFQPLSLIIRTIIFFVSRRCTKPFFAFVERSVKIFASFVESVAAVLSGRYARKMFASQMFSVIVLLCVALSCFIHSRRRSVQEVFPVTFRFA